MPLETLLSEVRGRGVKRVILFDLGGIRDRNLPDMNVVKKITDRFDEVYLVGHVRPGDEPRLEGTGLAGIMLDFRRVVAEDER